MPRTDWLVSANSEAERYLRLLQLIGEAPLTSWTVRALGPAALERAMPADTLHPWGQRFFRDTSGSRVRILMPEAGAIYNSGFPYGINDGPVWAGRGLTGTVQGGIIARSGPFSLTLAPSAFRAGNSAYDIIPTGLAGGEAYADYLHPQTIDLPQRFGDRAYGRVDPGQSTIRYDGYGVAAGFSTANEYWGPSVESPFLFGTAAAGFRHFFLGTSHPLTLGPLTLNGRVISGELDQSDFFLPQPDSVIRTVAGLVASASIRQLPGLEVGVGRVFLNRSVRGSGILPTLGPLFESLLKSQRARSLGTERGDEPDDQLASVFARWTFPSSGAEVYAELGREDNAYDLRDLLEEPDHDFTYVLGMQRAWRPAPLSLVLFRAETYNSQLSHLQQVRIQAPNYIHTAVLEGFTERGQPLGAEGGYGGGASRVAVELYRPAGRQTLSFTHLLRMNIAPDIAAHGVTRDVVDAATLEWLRFGEWVDVTQEFTFARDVGRNLRPGTVYNARYAIGTRFHW